jgi:hypothetical protein
VAASADHFGFNPAWPQALAPAASRTDVQPHPVPNCRRATIQCLNGLARRLRDQWHRLDASCDHRAVMSLSYLRITEAIRDDLARPQPLLFHDRVWFTYATIGFSNKYFATFRAHDQHKPIATAWQIAYEAMAHGDVSAGQDILLFSNAHVQHDLPFAYEEMGLRTPAGVSHKPDHDAVNQINSNILDPTQDEVTARYDPTFGLVDLKPSPLDEIGSMELVKTWRESAWRNAERLLAARTPAEHAAVVLDIQRNSAMWARMLAAPQFNGFRKMRDDYCRGQQARRGGN